MKEFKQNSSNSVLLGPIVYASAGDNVTPYTSGALTTAIIQVQKGVAGFSNADNSAGAAQARGYYPWTASSSECDTTGELLASVSLTGYMPYEKRINVITPTAYAETYSSSVSTTTINNNLVSVGTDTTSIIGNLASAQTDITGLTANLTSTSADVIEIQANVISIGTDTTGIPALQADLTSTQADVTGLIDHITTTGNATTDSIETAITNAQNAINTAGNANTDALELVIATTGNATTDAIETAITNSQNAVNTAGDANTGTITTAISNLNDLGSAGAYTAANAALIELHLDHLLAATYDPASKPGAADALLNEIFENDGGVSRFTANALENAPTSTAGALTADTITDAILNEVLAGAHTAGGSTGEALILAAAGGGLTTAQVQASAAAALDAYDPPTRAELTTDINSVITAGNANTDALELHITTTGDAVTDSVGSAAMAEVIEQNSDGSDVTAGGALRLLLAVNTGLSTGGGGTTLSFRDIGNSKTVLSVDVDAVGNRVALNTRDET